MDHHHNLENFVPPALDAGCSIVTDKDTNLDDIDMIYSKRPSTIGLNMALGRTRTNSLSPSNQANRRPSLASSSSEADLPTTSRNLRQTVSSSSPPSAHPRLLRFYSYVDMLSDENLNQNQNTNTNQMHSTNNVRPSLLSHYSSNSTYSPRLHLSPTSVSYTHLDVYKRQSQNNSHHNDIQFFPDLKMRVIINGLEIMFKNTQFKQDSETTHSILRDILLRLRVIANESEGTQMQTLLLFPKDEFKISVPVGDTGRYKRMRSNHNGNSLGEYVCKFYADRVM